MTAWVISEFGFYIWVENK